MSQRKAIARIIASGATCRACLGTGLMEDGPAGATYSAPCVFCRDDIPTWAWDKADQIISLLGLDKSAEAR